MMNRRRAVGLFVAVFVALVVALTWWEFGTRHVPTGQPPLVTLDSASVAALRDSFNQAVGDVRIIVLVSPT